MAGEIFLCDGQLQEEIYMLLVNQGSANKGEGIIRFEIILTVALRLKRKLEKMLNFARAWMHLRSITLHWRRISGRVGISSTNS